MTQAWFTAGLLWAMLSVAHAQTTVHRCGNTYSQLPCHQSTVIDVDDSRSRAQQVSAERVNADQRRLATQMQRDRLAETRATRPAAAVNLGSTPGKALPAADRPRSTRSLKGSRSRTRQVVPERFLIPGDETARPTPKGRATRNRQTDP